MSEQQDGPAVDPLVEVLAYLVTAARTQVDEAAEYGPMRLVTAARRLADAIRPQAPPELAGLLTALDAVPETATPRSDPAAYAAMLDGLCAELADGLLALPSDAGGHAPERTP